MFHGGQLCVNSSSVVCLGAPKTGILSAIQSGNKQELHLADVGIPQLAWKHGTRRKRGIDFGGSWVVPLYLQWAYA